MASVVYHFFHLRVIFRMNKDLLNISISLAWASLMAQMVKNPPVMPETLVLFLVGKIPGEGKGYPLQYSGLENSMDHI